MENQELAAYMSRSIEQIISDVLRNTFQNPKETAFLLKYRKEVKKAADRRSIRETAGLHVPSFLISSITNSCNLFCKGCYARANGICRDETEAVTDFETACQQHDALGTIPAPSSKPAQADRPMLSDSDWDRIFCQASELGISFHLLAGGEPLLRPDVMQRAASHRDTIYPIFTNGTLLDDFYCDLLDKNRNLIPIFSLEGSEASTDSRRGGGTYQQVLQSMERLQKHGILFGVSLTVSKDNLKVVTASSYIELLRSRGCRVIFFIEYVPVDPSTRHLAFSEEERIELEQAQDRLRKEFQSVLFLSFPGDERNLGGCLAAGRGFFHINPYGDAEACPFSPYSDCSLTDHTLSEVLQSPFFESLRRERLVGGEHTGGCALFDRDTEVAALLSRTLKTQPIDPSCEIGGLHP